MLCRYCEKTIEDGSAFCNHCGRKQEKDPSRRHRANGQGTVYQRGSTYTAKHSVYRNGQRIERTKGGFKTKKAAYDWLAQNPILLQKQSRISFVDLYDKWSAAHYESISPRKATQYRTAYRVCSSLRPYYWDEITLEMMQNAVNSAYNSYNPRKNIKLILHMMEDYANINGYGERHITQYIKLPPRQSPNKKPFTQEEIRKLFDGWNAGDKWAGIILIMICTGMRYGEISTIKEENIHIEDSYMIGGIKTEHGKQGEILIIDAIKPIVQELMIPNSVRQISTTTFTRHFKACLQRNGCEDHSSHECRHTTATLLAEAGVNGMVIKDVMRHSSYAQAEPYTHTSRRDKLQALESMMHI